MTVGIKVQVGLALTVCVFSLSASALTFLPGEPADAGGLMLGVEFVLLFPLVVATIGRAWALQADGVRLAPSMQWLALRCLPRAVQLVLACAFAAGIALMASGNWTSRQAGETEHGRYYVIEVGSPTRERVEVSKSEYDTLLKNDRRAMHAISAMLAAGTATMTLIVGEWHPTTGRPGPPLQAERPTGGSGHA
ncbi:hypothetical protein [Streptomyces wuyuanensis]|uniref:hypothetical protein n=1 Tax=Streptomyces wuyuanensis TaxID=1196353 RepID=UPI00371D6F3E